MRTILQTGVMSVTLALIGCGGNMNDQYDFKGTWTGTLSSAQSPCSDGSSVPADVTQVSFNIMSTGNNQIFWHAKCGDLYFTQHGNIATQSSPVACTPTVTPTSQVTPTVHDTSLVLNGNALQVDLVTDVAVATGGKTGSCNNIHASGTLVRSGGS